MGWGWDHATEALQRLPRSFQENHTHDSCAAGDFVPALARIEELGLTPERHARRLVDKLLPLL